MTDQELYHHGVLGMKWGVRKKYKEAVANARLKYKNRNSSIQNKYDKEEANIESSYRRGQKLSRADMAREEAADKNAQTAWRKSKADYKHDLRTAKAKYKADLSKMKTDYKNNYKQLKSNRTADDILIFSPGTMKKAAVYMTENKMTMAEAKKKSKTEAVRNTAIALGVIGSVSIYDLIKRKINK